MKTKILLVSGLFTLSLVIILALFISSRNANDGGGGFRRVFRDQALGKPNVLDIQYSSYYIAGTTSDQIYLGNVTAPLHMLMVDTGLVEAHPLSIDSKEKLRIKATQIKIDSPYFYMTDLMSYAIFRGTLKNLKADRFMYDSTFFAEAVPISASSFAIRTFATDAREYLLARETSYPPYINRVPGLLEKQIDGLFCTDGMLHYNSDLKQLVYLYFYRNEFICMDTSLNLLYRSNTIDTTSRAKIEVAEIESEGSIAMSSPPLIVNKKSCVSGNWLFVNSNLMAANEDERQFASASVIDVYNLLDGSYKFSFYLPDHEGKKIRGFVVSHNRLLAVYTHYILSYPHNTEFFYEKNKPF